MSVYVRVCVGGGGVLKTTSFYTGRFYPKDQTLTVLYTIFGRRGLAYKMVSLLTYLQYAFLVDPKKMCC